MPRLATKKNETPTAIEALVVPEIRSNKGNSALLALIDKALKGARNMVQTAQQTEPLVQEAALAAIEHAKKHGDATPADRLIKGLMALNHPSTSAMARETVAWFRSNSPIRWDAKGKVSVLKEGQEGYKPYDVAKATEVPFNETPAAKRARDAASRAHKQNLQDATFDMMIARAKGTIAWFNNMASGKDERKVNPTDAPKMVRFGVALNGVLKEFGGETATVEIVKPTKAKKAA